MTYDEAIYREATRVRPLVVRNCRGKGHGTHYVLANGRYDDQGYLTFCGCWLTLTKSWRLMPDDDIVTCPTCQKILVGRNSPYKGRLMKGGESLATDDGV